MPISCNPVRKSRNGQTLIFMAMVIVMIAFATLFYFDVHKVLHVKAASRNAGDAAALAGARWQAISLNLIGNLNVAQAVAMTESLAAGQTESPEALLISDLQKRIAFSGPLFGFLVAQQAAKNNGIHNQPEFANELRAHADVVQTYYEGCGRGDPFLPMPPMGTAWDEYADILRLIADHGMAVHCNNARIYGTIYEPRNHMLLDQAFYDAIAGQNWCWFYHGPYGLLQSYSTFGDWPDLAPVNEGTENSEFFGLRLNFFPLFDRTEIATVQEGWSWEELFERYTQDDVAADPELVEFGQFNSIDFAWYAGGWGSWSSLIPSGFPWDRDIKDEYNYGGADAAVRVKAVSDRHTDFQGADSINWTAAAKPFGTLEGGVRPTNYDLVLPAYTEVRLIPVDTSSGGVQGSSLEWLEFVSPSAGCGPSDLERYLAFGPSALSSDNYYARQLITWEQIRFRAEGIDWLQENSGDCNQPPPGGGGSGGGSYHGH